MATEKLFLRGRSVGSAEPLLPRRDPKIVAARTIGATARAIERTRRRGAAEPEGPPTPAWRRLAEEAKACRRCPLHMSRTHVVFYRGGPAPSVVFVGEAPGREEDLSGRPFVGRAGKRLDEALGRLGLADGSYGIVNLVKCRPPENRFDRAAALACRSILDRQLELLAPERLVTLGAHALRLLDPDAPPIVQAAGTPRRLGARPLFPLLHPAAALHAPRYRARWEADVGRLAEWLRERPGETL